MCLHPSLRILDAKLAIKRKDRAEAMRAIQEAEEAFEQPGNSGTALDKADLVKVKLEFTQLLAA